MGVEVGTILEGIQENGGWQNVFLPEDLTIEHNGSTAPLRDLGPIKEAKDIATLAKAYVDSQSELGRRIRLPGKDATPEDIQSFREDLREKGILPKVPQSVEEYSDVKLPEGLPESLTVNEELFGKFKELALKHGLPPEAAAEFLTLQGDVMTQLAEAVEQVTKDPKTVLTTLQKPELESKLRTEFGDQYDERREMAKRMIPLLIKDEDELAAANAAGLGDHPGFLSLLMRLAPLAMQDSSFVSDLQSTEGGMTGDEVRSEVARIANDKAHPMHAGYHQNPMSADVQKYIDGLYKKAYGDGKVSL